MTAAFERDFSRPAFDGKFIDAIRREIREPAIAKVLRISKSQPPAIRH